MTPRTSVRAAARDRYGELRKKRAVAKEAPPTPDPPSLRFGAASPSPPLAAPTGGGEQTDLTARIRVLYEETSVPVREIAAIAGVTERTLYKYVEKHGWKKRYAVLPRGVAAARANRGRRWRPAETFAPAKGSGGRFIRREDIGKPFAAGLKAIDAQGRAQAMTRCDEVEPAARAAQQEADRQARWDGRSRALAAVKRAAKKLADYRDQCAAHRAAKRRADQWIGDPWRRPKVPSLAPSDEYERALKLTLAAATDWLEAEQRDENLKNDAPR